MRKWRNNWLGNSLLSGEVGFSLKKFGSKIILLPPKTNSYFKTAYEFKVESDP